MLTQLLRYYRVPPRLFPLVLSCLLPGRGVAGARAANMGRAIATVKARIARGATAERRDFWYYVLRYVQGGEASGLLASDDKVDDGGRRRMSEAEMYTNAFSISIAGSDGTATALVGALYLILKDGAVVRRRVAEEVRSAFAVESDITSSMVTASKLPYLDAVLHEAMRMYPPVAITLPRRVPPGGEVIEGRMVEAGYTVGVNHLACYSSEGNFETSGEFRPERWLDGSGVKGAFHPFSHGPRACLGKNLAWAEMRLILARLLWRFHIEMVEDGRNMEWLRGQRIWGFWAKPPLLCRLVHRHK